MREPPIYKPILCLADVGPHPRITARGFRFNNGKLKAKILTLMGVSCDQGMYGTVSLEATLRVAVACPLWKPWTSRVSPSSTRTPSDNPPWPCRFWEWMCIWRTVKDQCNRKITAHLILVQLFRSFWNHNMDRDWQRLKNGRAVNKDEDWRHVKRPWHWSNLVGHPDSAEGRDGNLGERKGWQE